MLNYITCILIIFINNLRNWNFRIFIKIGNFLYFYYIQKFTCYFIQIVSIIFFIKGFSFFHIIKIQQ